MIAVCIIYFFPSLQEQIMAAWADEKCAWWQTKEQCEFCHTIRCTNNSLYLKFKKPKQNRKNQSIETLNLLRFFVSNLLKWKYFVLEILYELFKWKVMPFWFFLWASMISLSCSLLRFLPPFFLFLSFFPLRYPCSQDNRNTEQSIKTMENYICLSVGI